MALLEMAKLIAVPLCVPLCIMTSGKFKFTADIMHISQVRTRMELKMQLRVKSILVAVISLLLSFGGRGFKIRGDTLAALIEQAN